AEDGIRDFHVTGVQTCALPIYALVFFFGVLVIGYKPFVTNYLDHGKVLYPAVDQIMKGNVPENILTLPAPVKFVYGIGAVTGERSEERRVGEECRCGGGQ